MLKRPSSRSDIIAKTRIHSMFLHRAEALGGNFKQRGTKDPSLICVLRLYINSNSPVIKSV